MKKVFLISMFTVLIVSFWMSLALSAPLLVCDPAPAAELVTHVQVTTGGVAGTWVAYTTQTFGGVLYCVLQDLSPLANGNYTVTVKFRNSWGDSVASAPFTFTKALPGRPSGMDIK